jgi:hypothetical protein
MSDALKFPPVLDACCGSRMFWFDHNDARATFVDKRREQHMLPDVSSKGGRRELIIDPDYLADFTELPLNGARMKSLFLKFYHLPKTSLFSGTKAESNKKRTG